MQTVEYHMIPLSSLYLQFPLTRDIGVNRVIKDPQASFWDLLICVCRNVWVGGEEKGAKKSWHAICYPVIKTEHM